MSQENVELMRRALEAFNSGDPDAMAAFAHPEGQMEENNSVFPGLDRVYVGPEGFRQWYRTVVIEAWEDFRVDVEELRALDHEQVLVHARLRARGRQSGVEVRHADLSDLQRQGWNGREATSVLHGGRSPRRRRDLGG
jgi:SnoaL-like domain